MDRCAHPIQVYLLFTETKSRQNTEYNNAITRNAITPKHGINKQINLISISLWMLVLNKLRPLITYLALVISYLEACLNRQEQFWWKVQNGAAKHNLHYK